MNQIKNSQEFLTVIVTVKPHQCCYCQKICTQKTLQFVRKKYVNKSGVHHFLIRNFGFKSKCFKQFCFKSFYFIMYPISVLVTY